MLGWYWVANAMTDDEIRVRFWGTRGSIPVSGPEFERYGGNTPCIELQCGEHRLIFDAGSGIREAGEAMAAEGVSHYDLFFTHSHYDHIMGLPYFVPVYNPAARVKFWSGHLHSQMTTRNCSISSCDRRFSHRTGYLESRGRISGFSDR